MPTKKKPILEDHNSEIVLLTDESKGKMRRALEVGKRMEKKKITKAGVIEYVEAGGKPYIVHGIQCSRKEF